MIGTTDLDHAEDIDQEASISDAEADYLLESVNDLLPEYALTHEDIISTWSGVRPVISSGTGRDPSREKRDHSIWDDQGMISVSGGKLTTFRVIAGQVLDQARRYLPDLPEPDDSAPVFAAIDSTPGISELAAKRNLAPEVISRLSGHFGRDFNALAAMSSEEDLTAIDDGVTQWIELRWAARNEQVVHLDDLLLRRTRVGMLLPEGASGQFGRIEQICREELGWDEPRWNRETDAYLSTWRAHYAPPNQILRPEGSPEA